MPATPIQRESLILMRSTIDGEIELSWCSSDWIRGEIK
jgi:hypothetical protein